MITAHFAPIPSWTPQIALAAPSFRRVTVAEIQQRVARQFRIPLLEMKSGRRRRDIVRPRQVAMYLSRRFTPRSLPEIGRYFGGRDHTTVIHAIKTIQRLRAEDLDLDEQIAWVEGELIQW